MSSKQIVTGVVGVIVGFILGFFVAQYVEQNRSAAPSSQAPAAGQEARMPEGHPPPETIERLRELQQRAQANPQDPQVRIVLANLYYDMGRFDAAINWYEEVLNLDPSNVSVRTDLGTAYLYTGNPTKAIELYRKSLEIQPDHPQTLQNLGFAYFSSEKFQEAIQSWQQLLDTHPEYPHVQEIKKQMESARARLGGKASS